MILKGTLNRTYRCSLADYNPVFMSAVVLVEKRRGFWPFRWHEPVHEEPLDTDEWVMAIREEEGGFRESLFMIAIAKYEEKMRERALALNEKV